MSTELVSTKISTVAQPDASDTRAKIKRVIGEGIKDLQLAFPLVAQSPEDRERSAKLYAVAVDGFPEAVAAFALRWLCFNNPRNTPTFVQPPTPQDVRECCQRVLKTWESRIVSYYVDGLKWGKAEQASGGQKPLPWGPEPTTYGCNIPDELVVWFMRKFTGGSNLDKCLLADRSPNELEFWCRALECLRPEFFNPGRWEELRKTIDMLRRG